MASPRDRAIADRHYVEQHYLSPLATVKDFFEVLEELRSVASNTSSGGKRLVEVCERVSVCGEQVVRCLEQQIKQHNRASETAHEVSGVFRLSLQRLRQMRVECSELKRFAKELQLAEHGLDARPMNSTVSSGSLQEKQRDFVIPGTTPIPRALSYDDFRKHRDLHLSSKRSTDGSSNLRKAKSDTDVAVQSLKKKVDSLHVDNIRLRTSEKKLLKQNIGLNRKCTTLEQERDRAEDRLKIEQTQRDSIEKLRERNKELEEQLRKLCDTQVIREREMTQDQKHTDSGGGGESHDSGGGGESHDSGGGGETAHDSGLVEEPIAKEDEPS